MATGNKHQKFGEVRPCGLRVMRVDRQTDRHTHHNTLMAKQPNTMPRTSALTGITRNTVQYNDTIYTI